MPSPCTFRKIDPRFDSDNRGGVAYRTAAIHDLDGSTTGIPDSYVLINDGENDSVATDGHLRDSSHLECRCVRG